MKELLLSKIKKEVKGKVIFLCYYGSHLYGTQTETSDTDIRGIFLPNYEDLILDKATHYYDYSTNPSNSKNTTTDIDVQLWSIHALINKLKRNDTNALDLVFAKTNKKAIILTSPFWENFTKTFIPSKNISGLIGYVYYQAKKYGIKGSNLAKIKSILDVLKNEDPQQKLEAAIPKLKDMIELENKNNQQFMKIMNKLFPSHLKIKEVTQRLEELYLKYGHRARLAMQNQGIDWKALHHAYRCILQAKSLLQYGVIIFPFQGDDLQTLIKIKKGMLPFQQVKDLLEKGIEEIKNLEKESQLPDQINLEELYKLIIAEYKST